MRRARRPRPHLPLLLHVQPDQPQNQHVKQLHVAPEGQSPLPQHLLPPPQS